MSETRGATGIRNDYDTDLIINLALFHVSVLRPSAAAEIRFPEIVIEIKLVKGVCFFMLSSI